MTHPARGQVPKRIRCVRAGLHDWRSLPLAFCYSLRFQLRRHGPADPTNPALARSVGPCGSSERLRRRRACRRFPSGHGCFHHRRLDGRRRTRGRRDHDRRRRRRRRGVVRRRPDHPGHRARPRVHGRLGAGADQGSGAGRGRAGVLRRVAGADRSGRQPRAGGRHLAAPSVRRRGRHGAVRGATGRRISLWLPVHRAGRRGLGQPDLRRRSGRYAAGREGQGLCARHPLCRRRTAGDRPRGVGRRDCRLRDAAWCGRPRDGRGRQRRRRRGQDQGVHLPGCAQDRQRAARVGTGHRRHRPDSDRSGAGHPRHGLHVAARTGGSPRQARVDRRRRVLCPSDGTRNGRGRVLGPGRNQCGRRSAVVSGIYLRGRRVTGAVGVGGGPGRPALEPAPRRHGCRGGGDGSSGHQHCTSQVRRSAGAGAGRRRRQVERGSDLARAARGDGQPDANGAGRCRGDLRLCQGHQGQGVHVAAGRAGRHERAAGVAELERRHFAASSLCAQADWLGCRHGAACRRIDGQSGAAVRAARRHRRRGRGCASGGPGQGRPGAVLRQWTVDHRPRRGGIPQPKARGRCAAADYRRTGRRHVGAGGRQRTGRADRAEAGQHPGALAASGGHRSRLSPHAQGGTRPRRSGRLVPDPALPASPARRLHVL